MLEKLRHTVEMRVRRYHIHMRPKTYIKLHKLTHQFCEIDFIQKVLVDVTDSNTVIRRLLCSTVELKTVHWAHCR